MPKNGPIRSLCRNFFFFNFRVTFTPFYPAFGWFSPTFSDAYFDGLVSIIPSMDLRESEKFFYHSSRDSYKLIKKVFGYFELNWPKLYTNNWADWL